ncbi:hypothetical protein AAFN88_20830 [Pelagibius sp. CAU 1746]|uniref:hypothetical protein n=1 Tax=Pelagibius sp. CAU 1746 TaxID=3140370 RepID=UPI00325A53D6
MKLSVAKSITGTLSFCLRHAVGFYLLGLLVNLPSYLYSLLVLDGSFDLAGARPWWEENIALAVIESLLGGFVIAVMTRTLLHDRLGEDWSMLAGLAESFTRLPRVCGAALVFSIIVEGGLLLAEFLGLFSAIAALAGMGVVVWWAVILSVAVPVAALDDGDFQGAIFHSLERSGELTKGSRWRIAAIFVLPGLPLIGAAAAFVLAVGADFVIEDFPPLWSLLAGAIANAFFFALPAVVHEALVTLQEGPAAQKMAMVFD